MASNRKLAAIMFTDMVGYSALSNSNEKKAIALLEEHRSILREQFPKYRGREIKTIGDAFLVEYSSSLESINSAIAIQKSLDILNTTRDNDDKINLRIGIHLGDILKSEDDVHGDGVNIASRIEPFADSGGICISQQIYDQVKNKVNFELESLGKKDLKNISQPVELFRVLLPWQKVNNRKVGDRKVENSIAVLPFMNMSSDKENEYFSDGITEELLNVLAREKDLKVISRTSSFSYKGKDMPLRQIGRELGVETVLEGSVRKAGNRVRITAQLIRVADDFHLYSNTYDRTLEDIFSVQDEIATTILSELLYKLTPVKQKQESKKTVNTEAYNLYLQGRYYWNKRTKKDLLKAVDCFENAIKIDTEYGLACCGLTDSWTMLYSHGHMKKDEALIKSKSAVGKAEALGEKSAEFFTSKSGIFQLENDLDNSIEYLKKAIEINPNYATAHHWLSNRYSLKNEMDKGVEEIEKALSLDPLSAIIHYAAALVYQDAKMYDRSIELFQKTDELSPGFKNCKVEIGKNYSFLFQWEKAEETMEALTDFKNSGMEQDQYGSFLYELIFLYLKINKWDKARETLNLMETEDKTDLKYYYVGELSYFLRDFRKSYDYLKKYCELGPDFGYNWNLLSQSAVELGKYDEVIEALEKADELSKEEKNERILLWNEWVRGTSYIKENDHENAYMSIHKIKNWEGSSLERDNALSQLYFLLGSLDKGFEHYQKFAEKHGHFSSIVYDLAYDNARKDPRYIKILEEMNLLPYWKKYL